MFAFPGLDPVDGQQEIGVFLYVGGDVDDTGRADELARRDSIRGIIWQVFAGDPVDWRIEVRSSMLAQADHIPVPGWPSAVVV